MKHGVFELRRDQAREARLTSVHLIVAHGCVVNEDGSLSRITNWSGLSDHEREVAKRRIAKRNKERLDALKAAEAR